MSVFPVKEHNTFPAIPLEECLAKTHGVSKGCNVYTHLSITCKVIRILRKLYEGTPRQQVISEFTEWLSALHDIGKVTPAFQQKIHKAANQVVDLGKELEENSLGHAFNSWLLLEKKYGETFARLAGWHHGTGAPNRGINSEKNEELGGKEWNSLREKLISRLNETLSLPECNLNKIPHKEEPLILGATVLADWLSSGMDIPFDHFPDDATVEKAIRQAGFSTFEVIPRLAFSDINPFQPTPLQKICSEKVEPGGVYLIESEMGSGKTEAALYLAYRLLEQKKANGIYFALPTQLTSERIHQRMNDFLKKILPEHPSKKSLLVHGDAWLQWNLWEPGTDGQSLKDLPDEWFQSKKRALLAPFGVGTVDQALMSVINVKHKALRAFALSGKVVIIDEVHSYDGYTGTLILDLVNRLREWGCTVLILSATLTKNARKNFLLSKAENLSSEYPLLTLEPPGDTISEYPVSSLQPEAEVLVEYRSDEVGCLIQALEKAKAGQQVLWIENRVSDAQRIFQMLTAEEEASLEIGLIHSRFPVCIREKNETRWVDLLGKDGGVQRREKGRILVGTQVLEQSIDIDADFLVSRLAPSDMLFQRIGRLWRHRSLDSFRPPDAQRKTVILYDPMFDEEERFYQGRKNCLPYEGYVLWRTHLLWRGLKHLVLPKDIRPVLENTYSEREETGRILSLKMELNKHRDQLELLAGIAQGDSGTPQEDDFATTRYGEEPTVQVLLIRKGNGGRPLSQELHSPFVENPIPLPLPDAPSPERKNAVRALTATMIKVRMSLAPSYEDFPTAFLSHLLWTGSPGGSRPVRAAWLDESGRLLDQSCRPLNFIYHPKTGYSKRKENL